MTALRCLVVGGSGTLGQVVCAQLAARGCRVAFTWHEGTAAADALAAAGATPVQVDLTSATQTADAVARAAAALGGLDALIHCAARSGAGRTPEPHATVDDIDERAWDELYAVNVRSAFFAARRAHREFGADGGTIVLVGSIDGLKLVPAPAHYASSKSALAGLTRALAKELGARNIRVNLVAPGVLEGGLSASLPEALRADFLAHTALGKQSALADVASLCVWLACENTAVTGQIITVDGGL